MAEKLLEIGCDSICIKDMAALLKPQPAYDLVKGIKRPAARTRACTCTCMPPRA
jgi:pyruvate/oxaloacetate carboxyltransferase